MKILPWLLLGILLTVIIVEATQQNIRDRDHRFKLKAIEWEKDSISSLLEYSQNKQEKLEHSLYNRESENIELRRLNEASGKQLKQWRQRSKDYEKALFSVLNYSDAVMDSLFRARYPEADSVRQLRTETGVD